MVDHLPGQIDLEEAITASVVRDAGHQSLESVLLLLASISGAYTAPQPATESEGDIGQD